MVYFGRNIMSKPEKAEITTDNFVEKQKFSNKPLNPTSETIKNLTRNLNYYGFDKKIYGIDKIISVPIGNNPTDAGILQSGALTAKKNLFVNQYQKQIQKDIQEQEKEQQEEMKQEMENDKLQQDVLLSYLTR